MLDDQTLLSKKNMRFVIKEDAGWYGRAGFAGKLFDSVVRVVSRVFQWLNTLM